MESPLSFNSSEIFRKKLLLRNLPPYKVEKSFSTSDVSGINNFLILDYKTIDSPKIDVIGDIQEKTLTTKNQYNPDNKTYDRDTVLINLDLGVKTNEGEYGYSKSIGSNLEKIGNNQETILYVKNLYGSVGLGTNYGDTVTINNTVFSNSNLGNYTYKLTIGSKLETIGENQESIHKLRNTYKPFGLGDFGSTVWYINDDQNTLTMGDGEYTITDTSNSYLHQIGNIREVYHKVINLYKPTSTEDYGNTVWSINNNQTIQSMGSGTYSITDTNNSYLFQIGNNQETILITKNKYSPENQSQYGDAKYSINNDLILGSNQGEYTYEDTIGDELELKGVSLRPTLFTKNIYRPEGTQSIFIVEPYVTLKNLIISSGNYNYYDTIGSDLEFKGKSERPTLITSNQYGPDSPIKGEVGININLQKKPNEGEYGYPDTISSELEDIGSDKRPSTFLSNLWGPEGPQSFFVIEPYSILKKLTINMGNYDYPDTKGSKLASNSEKKENDAYILNKYVTGTGTYGDPNTITIDDLEITNTHLPYANSNNTFIFLPSTYTPISILLNNNPSGSDGTLSQDSSLVKLAAKQLQKEFRHRVALELLQQTLGQVNILDSSINPDTGEISVKPNLDPFNALGLLSGQIPIISRNYAITNPNLFLGQSINFASKLAGTYSPYSYIPGEYFDYPNKKGSEIFNNTLSELGGFISSLFKPIAPSNQSPSELFVEYTSLATRDLLYDQLRFNNFRPDYKTIGNNLLAPEGKYYIGNRTSSITDIVSPSDELAESKIKGVGSEKSPVFSYGEISKEYEGSKVSEIYSGLNSRSYFDGLNGVQAGLTWLSVQNWVKPGDFAGIGGSVFQDNSRFNFSNINTTYSPTKSTEYSFTENSLLDVTQKLIDAGNRSNKKLQHVGNAINQVTKVFNDGYIELTKGSRVVRYSTKTSTPENERTSIPTGYEYCRVFTKDRPYYSFDELQKTDGNIRNYTNSILDNTYNLNIAPWKNPGSTNIQDGKVKKYMFSLENLSWRTSNNPGYTYEDLPDCERGPNGGRIMWFPPYDLTFDESTNTSWEPNTFLGRPEPIYTYNSTTRKGNISFKIIVDHPSIMNVILDKELENVTPDSQITKVLDSFFAGCTKYDLYDLVKKYRMFTPNDVFQVLEQITYPEDIVTIVETLPNEIIENNIIDTDTPPNINPNPPDVTPTGTTTGTTIPPEPPTSEILKFTEAIFFFHNDFPNPNSNSVVSTKPYDQWLTDYLGLKTKYLTTGGSDGTREFGKIRNKIIKYGDSSYVDYSSYINGATNDIKEKYLVTYINAQISGVSEFFDYIESEFEEIKMFLLTVCTAIKQGGKISFTLLGSASSVTDNAYNINLSKRRLDSAMQYILNFEKDGIKLKDQHNKNLIIKQEAQGENTNILDPKYKFIDCTKDFPTPRYEGVVSVNAMACRRVRIIDIKYEAPVVTPIGDPISSTETDENIGENFSLPQEIPGSGTTDDNPTQIDTKPTYSSKREKQDPVVKKTTMPRSDLTKRLARKLLTECNYFELIKETDPMIYDGLKSKLKHFHPAFHSITPEGLNSRLTFLHQCLRPGDTIPTVSKEGENYNLLYNDVTNSVFGAPPICVLRVGDFFHTKIVIDSLNFKYEDSKFDLNPEGIGVQPMIADVSISFNFIGGHGLAEPIAKLQNGLSFNFYANTEMYDERADMTENVASIYDAEILADIKNELGIVENFNKPRTNDNGETIGIIKTNNYDLNTQNVYGTISYEEIMKILVSNTKSYADTVIDNLDKINENLLLGGILIATKDRKYTEGLFDYLLGTLTNNVNIYGKSDKIQNRVKLLVEKTKKDVDDGVCPLLPEVQHKNFKDSTIIKIKKEIKKLIEKKGDEMLSLLETCNTKIAKEELKLIFTIDKLNFVATSNDGYIAKKGNVVIYNLSGGTGVDPSSVGVINTYAELIQDFLQIRLDLNEYYNRLYQDKIIISGTTEEFNDQFVFNTYIESDPSLATAPENRFFMLFGKPIAIDSEGFSNSIVDNGLKNEDAQVKNDWKAYFGQSFYMKNTGLVDSYNKSKKIVDERFKNFKDNFYKNKFTTYTPYNINKTRILDYSIQIPIIPPNDTNLKELWSDKNSGWDKFNLKKTFN